jgi:hypothetical protein
VSLIGVKSWCIFQTLRINADWLSKSPSQWNLDSDYLVAEDFVHHTKVVNDLAERAIKLIQDFANGITKDEEQRQYLLQVVENHRRSIPDFQKKTLKKI